MQQGGPCSVWSATWTVGDADGNKPPRISGAVRRVPEERRRVLTENKSVERKLQSTANMEREEAWRAFLFELQTSNSSFVRIRLPRGLPHPVASTLPFFFGGGLKIVAFELFIVSHGFRQRDKDDTRLRSRIQLQRPHGRRPLPPPFACCMSSGHSRRSSGR